MTTQTQILAAAVIFGAIFMVWVLFDYLLTREAPEAPAPVERPVDGDTTPLTVGSWT